MTLGTQVASLFALTDITFSQPTENQSLPNGSSLIQGVSDGMLSISAFLEMAVLTKVSKEDLPANFPPPPDSIPPEAINLPPLPKEAPLLAETYPAVTKYLGAFQNHSVEIYVVLFEDLYESDHGDGEFHYPDSIFIDEATAQEYCNKSKTDNDAYHLRKCRVKLDGVAILCELSVQSFDHVTDREVLKLLTEKLIQLPK